MLAALINSALYLFEWNGDSIEELPPKEVGSVLSQLGSEAYRKTRTRDAKVGRKSGTQKWDAKWDANVGRKGGTQRWDAKVGRKCGTQRWDAMVGRKGGAQK